MSNDRDCACPTATSGIGPAVSRGWCLLRGLCEPVTATTGLWLIPLLSGCGTVTRIVTPERLAQGYVLVLPGVEGRSFLNANVAKGLEQGHVPYAIEVYDWTAGSVFLFPISLCDLARNQAKARELAAKIVEYQDAYPGRPVHMVGHSGGGGLAILALEALPPGRQITSTIVLAPAIAPDHDLRRALRRTRAGIWNYYSPYDVGFLKAGTWIMGTIDGKHTAAAGQKGFVLPDGLDREGRQAYLRLHQVPYDKRMAETGNTGNHTGWAKQRFVAEWLAPLINSQRPAAGRYASDVPTSRAAS